MNIKFLEAIDHPKPTYPLKALQVDKFKTNISYGGEENTGKELMEWDKVQSKERKSLKKSKVRNLDII